MENRFFGLQIMPWKPQLTSNVPDVASLSVPIQVALLRLKLVSGNVGFWEVMLLQAVATCHFAKEWEAKRSGEGVLVVVGDLASFHRSLSRTANMRATMKHWTGLSSEGRTLIEMRLRLGQASHQSFEDLDLENASDLAVLRDAVGAAKRWLGEKPGAEHGAPIRALVRDVARVYQQATGKRPGLSSSETVAGSSYTTPFEDLLVAVLTEAGTPLSLEAARGLYRSELRNKSKKFWLVDEGLQSECE
jgi:hypothetical protein